MKKQIVIIGGGVIGASCAYELSSRGAQVTLIEKDQIGQGCSYGNAGWITPCFAMPLPMPGMLLKSMKWLLDPESPLHIKPSLNPLLFRWLTTFLLSMNEKKANASIEALVKLSKISLEKYIKLSECYSNEFEFKQNGLLMIAQTENGMKDIITELNCVTPYNIPGKILNSQEVMDFEPALKGSIVGGVYFSAEAQAEPLKVVQTLIKAAKQNGAQILENSEVTKFNFENDKLLSINTTNQEIKADVFVLATGSWSKDLAKSLGISIPILGGKGYAIIIPELEKQPKHPIMITEKKIAVTPRAHSLRIGGTLELVDQDFSITQRRVDTIIRNARENLYLPESLQIQETWRGLRPCTPDGVPLIGWSPKTKNLMLACGHQMLGLQSGMGTGSLVADFIEGKPVENSELVFSPARFN